MISVLLNINKCWNILLNVNNRFLYGNFKFLN